MIFRCRIESSCKILSFYQIINQDTQLIIDGICTNGCLGSNTIKYEYKIYKNIGDEFNATWQLMNDGSFISGLFLLILILNKCQ